MPVAGTNAATDLSPVGLAVEDGASVSVSHLKIRRDIYYTSDPGSGGDFSEAIDRSRILDLQDGQFFMLGDNSPRSKDGRYWRPENFVDRRLLIGKAMFVYWPHSFNYVELGSMKIPLPFWPNFARMRFVH
jgi:signal peptidase I